MLVPDEVINDRFRVVRPLGQGGMGAVFLANDEVNQEAVAIKVLTLPPGESQLRFRREFRLMMRLDHPHVIKIIESGVFDDLPFIIMPLLDGGNLLEVYRQPPSKEELPERLKILSEVADALSYIHGQGIIHRDLKPENVMLHEGKAYLMDFGLAKDNDNDTMALTQVGAVMGTAAYMSPEQARGQVVDTRSDLYAFGCLVHWMITGQTPFTGSTFPEILIKQLRDPPQAPSRLQAFIPQSLDILVLKLLEKNPADRYSAASDVSESLRNTVIELLKPDPERSYIPSEVAALFPEIEAETPGQLLNVAVIGRDQELYQLHRLFDDPPPQRFMLIEGDSGLGISRLLEDLRQEARNRQFLTLYIPNYQGVNVPFQGWKAALSRLRSGEPKVFGEASEGLEEALSLLMPEIFKVDGLELPADVAQLRLYDALDRLFGRIAKQRKFLILVDDIHLADEGSANLLTYLSRGESAEHILLVGAYHQKALDSALKRMFKSFAASTISLAPLSQEDTHALISALLGGEVEPQLLQHVSERVAGNPYFTEELVRSLLTSGQIARRAGFWEWSRGAGSLPPSIEDVFVQRLESLKETAFRTISIASTIGHVFEFDLLLELSQADEDALLDDLDDLLRADLVEERGFDSYRFSHPLLHEVLYNTLNARRRRRFHQKLADILSLRSEVSPEVLADHYAAADNAALAYPYAIEVADKAAGIFANDVAEKYYRMALSVLAEDEAHYASTQIALGQVLDRIGRHEEARTLFEQAATAGLEEQAFYALGTMFQKQGNSQQSEHYFRKTLEVNPDNLQACNDLGHLLVQKSAYDEAVEVLQECLLKAMNLAEGRDEAVARTQASLGYLEFRRGNRDTALEWYQSAEDIFKRSENELEQAKLLRFIGILYLTIGNFDDAEAYLNDAYAKFSHVGDINLAISTLYNIGSLSQGTGKLGKAVEVFEDIRIKAKRLGSEQSYASASGTEGWVYQRIGNYEMALALIEEAKAYFAAQGYVNDEIQAALNLAVVYAKDGQLQQARDYLAQTKVIFEQADNIYNQGLWYLSAGEVDLREKLFEQSCQHLQQAYEIFESLAAKQELLECLLLLAEAHLASGDQAACAQHLKDVAELAQQLQDPIWQAQANFIGAILRQDQASLIEAADALREKSQDAYISLVQASLADSGLLDEIHVPD